MYWMNSKFQTLFFIVAEGHTFDNAYRIAKQQLLERRQAKKKLEEQFSMEADALAKSNMSRDVIPFHKETDDMYRVMSDEVNFLEQLANALEPHRKYRDLPEQVAHQMSQREYWFYELMERGVTQIYAKGQIDWDTMKAMRAHPDYGQMIGKLQNAFLNVKNGQHLPPPADSPVLRFLSNVATQALPHCATEGERRIAAAESLKKLA